MASLDAAGGCHDVLRPKRKVAVQPKGKAKDRLSKWFGEKTDTSLIDQKLEDGGMPSAR